jgi:hypothetical protein
LVFGALNFKFNSAIMEIPDTSAESSLRCDASRKCSIPNSLDCSLDEQPRSEIRRFNRFGHTINQTDCAGPTTPIQRTDTLIPLQKRHAFCDSARMSFAQWF